MATISMRISDSEMKLIQEYTSIFGLNMSSFIRDTVLDKIEDDLAMDEERILDALEKSRSEKRYDSADVWEMLGV